MTNRHARLSLLIAVFSLCSLLAVPSSVTAPGAAVVAPEALPEDLRDLRIEEAYVPTSFKMAGVIHSVDGEVLVIHRADREAYLGSEGDPVHENDEFYTLPEGRCRLRFTNEDVVSLAPETRFSLDEYSTQEEKGEKTSLFSMVKGKAMFYAMRLFRFKKARFQVKTPTAVMGVRGTKFGAHVYYMDEKSADSGGVRVADSGRNLGLYLAQNGNGGTPVTVAACGDGSVDVNGNTLGPGEYYNSFTGTVGYDPTVLGGIEQSTGGSGGGGGGDEGGDDGDGGGGDGSGDMTGTLTNITNIEGGENTQGGESGGEDGVQLTKYGYFSALLKKSDMGGDYLEDVFIVKTPNAFGPGVEHKGESIIDSDYLIWEGGYTKVTVNDGTPKDPNTTITSTVLSNGLGYDYLQYGQWEHTGTFGSSPTYKFVNYAWWLEGYAPPADVIAEQKGSVPYAGEARGTMYVGAADQAYQLNGDFSATANFDNGAVQNFYLNVTDGGNNGASITGGAAGNIQADGTFKITGGDWRLTVGGTPLEPDHKGAHGRFFGPNVEEIGGDWGMAYDVMGSSSVGASGVWAGKKQ